MRHRILFVCLGNICRSPMAEGVFRKVVEGAGLLDHLVIDSAGTGSWHVGDPPDPRAQAAAVARGIDISGLRARQVSARDFDNFDLLLAMDQSNYNDLTALAESEHADRVRLFLDYAPDLVLREVPDPYYGGKDGFADVLNLVQLASEGLLGELRSGID